MDVTDNTSAASTTPESSAMAASCFTYDNHIYFAANIIGRIFTLVSLLATCLVLFLIILFKRWSFFNQRLVLYLSLATIISYITFGLSIVDGICTLAGFANHIGGWINLNAYICITATLIFKVFFTINLEKSDKTIVLFIFVSPFLFNWIPFISNTYGKAGPTCWIRNIQEVNGTCELFLFGQVLQLVLWYIPLYTILTIMIIVYAIIFVKFCFHRKQWVKFNQDVDSERKKAQKYIISLLAYPVIYFLVNIFPFINRIYERFNPATPSPVLMLLNGMFFPHQGLGIAIVFLLSIRNRLSIANFRAAANEWCHKTQIKEYPFNDDETELSLSGTYASFNNKR